MKKIKKIKIRVNGKLRLINENSKVKDIMINLKIPIKKVAIELNQVILNKKKIGNIKLKKNDKIEIVHFIGGG